MKKAFTLLFFLSVVLGTNAQSAFDKFDKSDKVATISLNKGVFDLVSLIDRDKQDTETKEFMDLVSHIDKLNVYMTKDLEASSDMVATAKKHIGQDGLEELMRIREEDSEIDFYVKSGKDDDHVTELFMLVSGLKKHQKDAAFETVALSMTGDIDLTKVGVLVDKLNLPEDLEKVEKSKSEK